MTDEQNTRPYDLSKVFWRDFEDDLTPAQIAELDRIEVLMLMNDQGYTESALGWLYENAGGAAAENRSSPTRSEATDVAKAMGRAAGVAEAARLAACPPSDDDEPPF
jgi:hypothetical protein